MVGEQLAEANTGFEWATSHRSKDNGLERVYPPANRDCFRRNQISLGTI